METLALKPLSETGKYLATGDLFVKITAVGNEDLAEDCIMILYDLQCLQKALQHVSSRFEAWNRNETTRDEHSVNTYALQQEGEFLFPMMEKVITTASLKVEILAQFLEHGGK